MKLRLVAFLALSVCVSVFLSVLTPGSLARPARQEASVLRACLTSKDPGVIIETCSRVIDTTSDRKVLEKALNRRGLAQHERGMHNEAIGDFNRLINLSPTVAAFYDNRANTYKAMGQLTQALDDANTAVRLAHRYAYVYNSRGALLDALGRYEDAVSDYTRAISISPNHAFRYYARGSTFLKMGNFNAAIEDFSHAFNMDRNWMVAIRDRGLAYKALGMLDKARSDLEWFNRVEPTDQIATAALNEIRRAPDVVVTSPTIPESQKRVALVIGNGAYRHAPELVNPGNDAQDVTQSLRALGFEVVEGRDLDFQGMRTVLRDFSEKLGSADLALFFYAGHAVQVAGHNYLVPIDAKLERAGDLDFDGVDVQSVLRAMETETRVNIVVLDACRDNPFTRSLKRSIGHSRSTAVGEGLAPIRASGGSLIAFATEPDNVALGGAGMRNSPFTNALLKHVGTPGLEVEQMFKRVRADVISATKGRQTPWSSSSLVGEIFLASPRQ